MNTEKYEVLRRKPKILYKYEYVINDSCLTCKHFLWDWRDIPFCGLGRNIYGLCFDNEPRDKLEVVDYD